MILGKIIKLFKRFIQSVKHVLCILWFWSSAMADPERFYADPDPTFQADAEPEPDPNFFS